MMIGAGRGGLLRHGFDIANDCLTAKPSSRRPTGQEVEAAWCRKINETQYQIHGARLPTVFFN
jgi:hypothetical protein